MIINSYPSSLMIHSYGSVPLVPSAVPRILEKAEPNSLLKSECFTESGVCLGLSTF